ncbi:hypothetical protein IEO21_07426 [Rhodonia placenta]|uniref:Phosphoglycerate mutase-like protein n=1 Tax=Rhodonia placenta TaxID=104341 RepID=A0A8H7NY29_9APHY|nr:hypothetical protein IEO21_07426 [Postia placenta]
MNRFAPEETSYKVLFFGRHGQGYRASLRVTYLLSLLSRHYSRINGDAEMTWGPDPLLTPLGMDQAKQARAAWLAEIPHGIPVPQRCYASPLNRALTTWEITFSEDDILGPRETRRVLVLEDLRETYGEHTCDKRHPLSVIQRSLPPPTYEYEIGMSEEDVLYRSEERESEDHVIERAISVLDRIFDVMDDTYISITGHGGIINGFLRGMGHGYYSLPTGGEFENRVHK